MADLIELQATPRDRLGKGVSRALRREGRVPGIVYGNDEAPQPISLNYGDVLRQYMTGQLLSTVFMLDIAGKKTRVIPREVQLDPVRDFLVHVDFMRLAEDAEVTVEVTVTFVNEDASPGLKRGGVLNVVRHTVEVVCPADAIPESLEADLSGLDIGDSLHISQIELPANVRPAITDRDFTIATIAGAAGGADEEEGAEEESAEVEAGEVPATAQKEDEGKAKE